MKLSFYHLLTPSHLAVLDAVHRDTSGRYLTDESRTVILTRINVPEKFRGQGHASRLLKEFLQQCDENEVTVILYISPSGGLNYDQLRDWYIRHGFEGVDGRYTRKPNGERK